jgi:hypothetical protein
MNTRSSPALSAVIDELTAVGATWNVTRSKHFKIRWSLGTLKAVTVVSVSSGTFAPNHALRDVRRQLRSITNQTKPAAV